jgi:hypothetical protein
MMGRGLDIAVGKTTGYRLDDRRIGVRVPIGARFPPLYVVQMGFGSHASSYSMAIGGFSLEDRATAA